ncbi:DUF1349 domain-containing protein [Hymenobacter profundi]|uniref:DUF1349 domain-containing protein n=1 Tax=Hymenobacter profundi TaxID=1982110 RepID=A0ABS6WUC4_9BACT|nr:DUF1349 domain-containing protein [Hymenobacter profundi]MBW3127182.1 DUF1349 domain-containing protein [Hymenobacter profundi]
MAKATTKKPKLTPEEQMAELARLTGSVASISHMGPSQPFAIPAPEPAVAPAPAPATAPSVAAPAPVEPAVAALPTTAPVVEAPTPVLTPAPAEAKAEPKGEKGPKARVAPAQVAQPAAAVGEEAASAPDEDQGVEPTPGPATGNTPQFSFDGLYAPSEEKKTFQVRITATHQQLFQQMGLLLGGGASSADVIHNILNQFVDQHEQQIQKALQRQLRQMMNPKK